LSPLLNNNNIESFIKGIYLFLVVKMETNNHQPEVLRLLDRTQKLLGYYNENPGRIRYNMEYISGFLTFVTEKIKGSGRLEQELTERFNGLLKDSTIKEAGIF